MAYTPTNLVNAVSASNQATDTLYTVAAGQKVILANATLHANAVNGAKCRLYIERVTTGTIEMIAFLSLHNASAVAMGVGTEGMVGSGFSFNGGGLPSTAPASTGSHVANARSIKGIVLEAGDTIKVQRSDANHVTQISVSGIVIS